MKTLRFLLLQTILLASVTCCDTNTWQSGNSHVQTVPAKVRYSDSYQPQEFADTNRLYKIINALPGIEQLCSDFADKYHLPGLVYGIVVDDSLVYAGGRGVIDIVSGNKVNSKSQFRIASLTKGFTALAILKLRDEGELNLADPAYKFLPELADLSYLTKDASPLTIQNLLSMTAGFPEDNPWGDRKLDITDRELEKLLDAGISFSSVPASRYEYSNLGYAILGKIISTVSGIPFQKYITREILQPLNMNNTCWEYSDVPADLLAQGYSWEDGEWISEPMPHDGAFASMGGLITSAEDFGKWVSFLLSAWPPRSGPETGPVRRSTLREMQKQGEAALYPDAKDSYGNPCPLTYGYGYGLVVVKWCNDQVWVMHTGGLPGFGSHYMFLPDYGIGIFSFANLTYAPTAQLNYEIKKVLFSGAGLSPRYLPCSEILAERGEQLLKLINTWDTVLEAEILADNFYLDQGRQERIGTTNRVLVTAGRIISVDPVLPENQLRGMIVMHGESARIELSFTLTPENVPKIQEMTLRLFRENQ